MISQEDFEEAYWYVEEHRTQELAYFDYLFGMAMYYYSKHDVDYVVMETGLGGKLDTKVSNLKKRLQLKKRG